MGGLIHYFLTLYKNSASIVGDTFNPTRVREFTSPPLKSKHAQEQAMTHVSEYRAFARSRLYARLANSCRRE